MSTILKNGRYFDVHKGEFVKEDIRIEGNKIVEIHRDIQCKDNDKVIDCNEKNIFPGFIDAHSHIGMWTYERNGSDANECVNPVTANMRAVDGLNPFDPYFKESVEVGITTAMITPGSGNVICGQAAIIKTVGKTVDEMVVKSYAGLKIALGENPKNNYNNMKRSPSSRMSIANILEENLERAKYYYENKEKLSLDYCEEYEIYIPLFKGEIPLKVHAHRVDDICTAVRIAEKYNLKYTLDHCTEGNIVKEYLAKRKAPVLVGPYYIFKGKQESARASVKNMVEMVDEGCEVSIVSDHPFSNTIYLPKLLGMIQKYGLKYDDAIRALTINPARAIGMEKELGSIEVGKNADIVIYNGDPLALDSSSFMTIINGKIEFEGLKA